MMKTRTTVHSGFAARKERERGESSSIRASAAVQMGTQLILWITFFGYDRAQQTIWQSALLWGIPLLVLGWVWKKGAPSSKKEKARYALLALLPCLMADAAFMLFALGGLIGQLIPQYPGWMGTAVSALLVLLTAWLSRPRGVCYGTDVLKWLLVFLFVCGTVFLRASNRADRLWPLLGAGVGATALTALSGAGALWGIALLFALPGDEGQPVIWGLIPWGLSVVWALWYGFVRPWEAGDVMAVAEKMMGFARHAQSVTLYEMAGVMWMLLLPLGLAGALSAGERIALRAFPRCKRFVPLTLLLLPGCAGLLIWPEKMLAILEMALPWRYALSLGTGVWLCALERRKR